MTGLRHGRVVLLLAVGVAIAGCGEAASSGSPTTTATTEATTAAPASSAGPAGSPALDLIVDASMLDVLPATVAGVAMEADPATADTLIGEPTLASSASAVAIARYVGPGDSGGDDLAIVSLIQLRPGLFDEQSFEVWRRDYDGSACDPAGGVVGTELATTIGTHAVFTGACAGGVTTYHTRLDGDILVSIIAAGPLELGAGVIEGLRP